MQSGSDKPWWWRDLKIEITAPVLVWIGMALLLIEAIVVSIIFD